ncbi:MAG: glycosyltransferase, partial [Gemmatimonadetes bacterium]|nr:glycosyltransferase [Gemmatimonadota bacterium]
MLFLSATYPGPPETAVSGTHRRMRVLLDACSRLNRSLHIAFLIRPDQDQPILEPDRLADDLRTYWGVSATCHIIELEGRENPHDDAGSALRVLFEPLDVREDRFYSSFVQADAIGAIRTLLNTIGPGLLFVHRLAAILPVLEIAAGELPSAVVFDLDDVEHKARYRALRELGFYLSKIIDYARVLGLARAEAAGSRLADASLVCSVQDKRYLDRLRRYGRIDVLPNTVRIPDLRDSDREGHSRHRALFIGDLRYEPNAVAVDLLCRSIWPTVRARCPRAELVIVGRHPPGRVMPSDLPGIVFAGFVDDLDEVYASCNVVCCPITFGGGTRIKLCEAAAYGKAIVSTEIGAEGLDFTDGTNIVIQDDLDEFAHAVADLFE